MNPADWTNWSWTPASARSGLQSRDARRACRTRGQFLSADVGLNLETQTLTLQLDDVGRQVDCPECPQGRSMKDHAPEQSWRHRDAMQYQTILTARVPRSTCLDCDVEIIAVPWAGKHSRLTLMFEAFAIEVLQAARNIQAVCMDRWQAYESSTEANVPNARIVHDRFHISKYLSEAVDKVRQAEHEALQAEGNDRLKGVRHAVLFNQDNLSDEKREQLDGIVNSAMKTGRAWRLREMFQSFWCEGAAVGGRAFFDRWYSWAIRRRLEPVKKVARMLKGRLNRILTWFHSPISNGCSEGFNSRNQSLKSAARGFLLFEHDRIRILFHCGNLISIQTKYRHEISGRTIF